MVEYKTTNIWDSRAGFILVPVNVVGVMGGGLAKDAKEIYPEECKPYFKACNNRTFYINTVIYSDPLIFFPTKTHWKNPSRYEWVVGGLRSMRLSLRETYKNGEYPALAIPALGCGLGGLKWAIVEALILEIMDDYKGLVEIYPPHG